MLEVPGPLGQGLWGHLTDYLRYVSNEVASLVRKQRSDIAGPFVDHGVDDACQFLRFDIFFSDVHTSVASAEVIGRLIGKNLEIIPFPDY